MDQPLSSSQQSHSCWYEYGGIKEVKPDKQWQCWLLARPSTNRQPCNNIKLNMSDSRLDTRYHLTGPLKHNSCTNNKIKLKQKSMYHVPFCLLSRMVQYMDGSAKMSKRNYSTLFLINNIHT